MLTIKVEAIAGSEIQSTFEEASSLIWGLRC